MSKKIAIDYAHLFRIIPGQYMVVKANDPEFTIVEANDSHIEMVMLSRDTIIGKPLFDVFPDTTEKYLRTGVSDFAEALRTVVRTGKPVKREPNRYDIKNKKSELVERYWQATSYPLHDENNKVCFICIISEDVTSAFVSDQKLVDTQQQLDNALSIGSIGTWVWDLTSGIIKADKNLARMFGLTEKEAARGMPLGAFTDVMHDDDRERIKSKIAHAIKLKTAFSEEYRIVTHKDTVRWVLVRGKVTIDKKTNDDIFTGVIFDISDRKAIELNLKLLAEASAALTASLDYSETLQNVASIMVPDIADWCSVDVISDKGEVELVAVAHRDPKKVVWAREYREKTGKIDLKSESGIGRVIREGTPDFFPFITNEMIDATAKNEQERKLARSLDICSVMTVPISSQGKTIGAISFIATDHSRTYSESDLSMAQELASRASLAITNALLYEQTKRELISRTQLQNQLKKANEELEMRVSERTAQLENANVDLGRSNQELQDFAYVASHDLQEPLRKIRAFGDILHEEYGAKIGDGTEYLSRMQNAAARMSVLIEDLLSFSRVTTHAKDLEDIDLNNTLKDVLEDLEQRITDTKGSIESTTLPILKADPTQMRQLFQNLLGNALKFHRAGTPPKIRITCDKISRDKELWYQIRIIDNGIGFDEKYLDRIFAVFQRLYGRESYEGTGIGLAVCRKIVERHGGTITATSVVDKGSTFIIELPADDSLNQKEIRQ